MSEEQLQHWFESIFAERDTLHYRQFFSDQGPHGGGIYTLTDNTFRAFNVKTPDPRFLTHGVFEFAPTPTRNHWLYASSGMSNPWGQSPDKLLPNDYSGLGYEFTLHTRERAKWPIQLLQWIMAVQLLVASGAVKGDLLHKHDRIPMGGSIGKKDGAITHLLVLSPEDLSANNPSADDPSYPPHFQLASGRVDLLILVGISTREAEFAKTQGIDALINLLRHHQVLPFTDVGRPSAI